MTSLSRRRRQDVMPNVSSAQSHRPTQTDAAVRQMALLKVRNHRDTGLNLNVADWTPLRAVVFLAEMPPEQRRRATPILAPVALVRMDALEVTRQVVEASELTSAYRTREQLQRIVARIEPELPRLPVAVDERQEQGRRARRVAQPLLLERADRPEEFTTRGIERAVGRGHVVFERLLRMQLEQAESAVPDEEHVQQRHAMLLRQVQHHVGKTSALAERTDRYRRI